MEEEDPYVKEDEIREKTTEKRWCDTKAMDHTLKPHHMTRTALLVISHAQARMHAKKNVHILIQTIVSTDGQLVFKK
jgi:hypothetical protein